MVFLALLILIPTAFAVFLGIRSADLERQLVQGSGEKEPGVQNTNGLDPSWTPGVVPTSYENGLVSDPLSYQLLYPDLYSTGNVLPDRSKEIDTAYLTFDSLPSSNTTQILDILDEYDVKATFFVMGTTDPDALEVMKDIVNRGHTIGLLSYSGSYQEIYQSTVDAYLNDFKQIYDLVYETTGVKAEIFRFPGGSVNVYNEKVNEDIIEKMTERGYIYYDWNASLEDAAVDMTPEELVSNGVSTTLGRQKVVMLAHDVVYNTGVCLEELLDSLPEYEMKALNEEVEPVQF